MTPEEVLTWLKVGGAVAGMLAPAYGVWVLLQKRVADLEAKDAKRERVEEMSRAEAERQQKAWWDVVDELNKTIAALDKSCSNATTELRTTMLDLKQRVDLHSGSNVANLAGIVRNYNEMVTQTMDTLREALREARGSKS